LGVATPLVVIDDFDIGWTLLGPCEADAPLIVLILARHWKQGENDEIDFQQAWG
jgi:hypothetical protein